MTARALILIDDADLLSQVLRCLEAQPAFEVIQASKPAQVVDADPDLVLLEASHSGFSADDLLWQWHLERPRFSVMLLLSAEELSARASRLAPAADDYLITPFDDAELRARVAASVAGSDRAPPLLHLTECRVDLARGLVDKPEGQTRLTTRETALLRYLAARPGRTIPRQELLREVWGYHDAAITRASDNTVRRLRTKIERDPANPQHIITVVGEGYRFQPGDGGPASALSLPGARPGSPRTNLPDRAPALVGRQALLEQLTECVREEALVTLTGPGGIGKTALARVVGAALVDEGAEVLFCSLEEARDTNALCAAVAGVLDIPLLGTGGVDALVEALDDRRDLVLILDNVEQVVTEAGAALERWLAETSVRFVVTTRERLSLSQERVVEVGPLDAEAGQRLFEQTCEAIHAGRALSEEDRKAVAEIVHQLDGIPLAIELAARRSNVLSPAQILARLDQRLKLLAASQRDLPARQSTLRATIDWSWQLLGDEERKALAACSVFRGGFQLDAAEEVLGPSLDGLELILSLRDKSLLYAVESEGHTRLGMYESIRGFAEERLHDSGEQEAMERAHAAWYTREGRAWARGTATADAEACYLSLSHEVGNLLAVVDRFEERDPTLAISALQALEPHFKVNGPFATAVELMERGYAAAVAIEQLDKAALFLTHRSHFLRLVGQAAKAMQDANKAKEILPDDASERVKARVVYELAGSKRDIGQTAEADPLFEEALSHAPPGTGRLAREVILRGFAMLREDQGRRSEAISMLEEAHRIAVEHDALGEQAQCLQYLAFIQMWDGDHVDAAITNCRRAEAIYAQLHNTYELARLRSNLGQILLMRGRHDEAQSVLEAALKVHRAAGARHSVSICLLNLALCDIDIGEWDAAERSIDEAETLLAANPRPLVSLWALQLRAMTAIGRGHLELARSRIDEGMQALGDDPQEVRQAAIFLIWSAVLAMLMDDHSRAATDIAAAQEALVAERDLSYVKLASIVRLWVDADTDLSGVRKALGDPSVPTDPCGSTVYARLVLRFIDRVAALA